MSGTLVPQKQEAARRGWFAVGGWVVTGWFTSLAWSGSTWMLPLIGAAVAVWLTRRWFNHRATFGMRF